MQVVKKKTRLMLYSTLVEIEVEVGVELGKNIITDVLSLNMYIYFSRLNYQESYSCVGHCRLFML